MRIVLAPLHGLLARPRLLVAAAGGLAVGFLAPTASVWTRLLLAWDGAVAVHLVLLVAMMSRSDEADLQQRADREDPGAVAILVLFVAASVASILAIGFELRDARAGGEASGSARAALVALTILLSWLFVHTMFGLHYAHDYYAGQDDRKGLKFPGEAPPSYWDFMYFSFNLGAAAQTSDVQIEAPRLRRIVLLHTIVSFLFNTAILALAINVGASALS